MQKLILFLFAIPIVSIVVVALYQFFDEMFKKTFHLERRTRRASDNPPPGVPRRRYSDGVRAEDAARNAEPASAAPAPEVSVAQVNGV